MPVQKLRRMGRNEGGTCLCCVQQLIGQHAVLVREQYSSLRDLYFSIRSTLLSLKSLANGFVTCKRYASYKMYATVEGYQNK